MIKNNDHDVYETSDESVDLSNVGMSTGNNDQNPVKTNDSKNETSDESMDLSNAGLSTSNDQNLVKTNNSLNESEGTLDLSNPINGPWNSTGLKVKTDDVQVSKISGKK